MCQFFSGLVGDGGVEVMRVSTRESLLSPNIWFYNRVGQINEIIMRKERNVWLIGITKILLNRKLIYFGKMYCTLIFKILLFKKSEKKHL